MHDYLPKDYSDILIPVNDDDTKKMRSYSALFKKRRTKGMVFQETHKSIRGAPEAIPGFKGS